MQYVAWTSLFLSDYGKFADVLDVETSDDFEDDLAFRPGNDHDERHVIVFIIGFIEVEK